MGSFPCGMLLLPWENPGDILESQTPRQVISMLTAGRKEQTAQKRKVHQVQAELAQLWIVGSSGHALGKERKGKEK